MEISIEVQNPQRKVERIKVLQSIQKNLSIIGVDRYTAMQQRSFNAKSIMTLLGVGLGIICTLMFLFVEAKTFFATIQSIYVCSAYIVVGFALLIMVLYLNELFQGFDDGESLANTSKWKRSHCIHVNMILKLNFFHFSS